MKTTKNFIHQIVTIGDRDVTNCETIYCTSDKPKFSMKAYLTFMKNVQYEIVNRTTNEIKVVY
jgi:hypothetical protein